ncbi:MAG TPA: phosphoglycerate dehydrogenase [Anaerolineaceae bacterium]|nr:phosphoglycerate dehydrogenase [Anaerolineaceae bacterium]
MPVVLLTAPYMLPFVERFRPVLTHFGVELICPPVSERMEEDQILEYAGKFDGTICGDDRYTRRALQACAPRLKVISKWGTGTDSIDRAACAELGIQLRNTPNAFTLPVADSVLGYMLTFARNLPWMDRAMKGGTWQKIPGRSLSECTLGVIGVGNVGKAVLRRARGFGMTLLGNDILPIPRDFLLENKVNSVSLEELAQYADFVSVNCDLNPTSYHLINKHVLSQMKPNAVLINTARGPVVNEPDLVAALQAGQIAGAALDVFEQEPLPATSPLLGMDNVLLAPHNSNSSPAAWEAVHWNTIRNLLLGLDIDPAGLEKWQKEKSNE